MRLHNDFLWRRFYCAEIWRRSKKKLLSLSIRCDVDSPPEKKSEPKEVHRRSQIIRNIYVAQINSRWNECWRYLYDIKMQFFTRSYHAPLALALFLGASIFKLTTSNMKFHEARYAPFPAVVVSRLWCIFLRLSFSAITVFKMGRMYRQSPKAKAVENRNLRF